MRCGNPPSIARSQNPGNGTLGLCKIIRSCMGNCAVSLFSENNMKKMINSIVSFINEVNEDKVTVYATQASYFFILSIIPFLMVLVSLIKYTPISEATIASIVRDIMPSYVDSFAVRIVEEVFANSVGTVSFSIVLALWSAAKGMQQFVNGINVVYKVRESRNWITLRLWAIVYTFAIIIVMGFLLLLVVFGQKIQNLFPENLSGLLWLFNKLIDHRMFIVLIILVVLFALGMKVLPNRKNRFANQIPGAILAAVSWYVVSYAISIYVMDFNGFSMYGSLTTWILLMIWVDICINILLIASEFNVSYGKAIVKGVEGIICKIQKRNTKAKEGKKH